MNLVRAGRPFRIAAAAAGAVVFLGVGGWFFLQHSLQLAFSPTAFKAVETVFKKAVSDIVVVRRQDKTRTVPPNGYAVAYEKDPAGFQADAKLADTWMSAISLAEAVFNHGPDGNWVRSADDIRIVTTDHRTDTWGHPFCVLRREHVLAVVSAGPAAPTVPNCKDISIKASELAQLPHQKLLETPGGALLLVTEKAY